MSSDAVSAVVEAPFKRARFWPQELVLGLLPLLLGFQVFQVCLVGLPMGLHGIADFRQLYSGGYMIRTGESKQLYDYDAEERVEEALLPLGKDHMLPINHPAFEELLFVPLSLLKYRSAYWLFMAFNIGLLVVCMRLLRRRLNVLYARWRWFPVLVFAVFYPLARALTQGQDSIILLVLLTGALASLDGQKDLRAGFLVGLGLFKFQVAIPIALLFLIWKRWRFCIGFGISASIAAGISCWIVGFEGVRAYMDTLISMSVRLSSDLDMLRYATIPNEMLNLRGLISAIFSGRISQLATQLLIFAASALVLILTAKQRPSLPLAITTSALISYHFIVHDASILILPLALALCTRDIWLVTISILLLITPFSALIPQYGYLSAVPLLAFFIASLAHSSSCGEFAKPKDLALGRHDNHGRLRTNCETA